MRVLAMVLLLSGSAVMAQQCPGSAPVFADEFDGDKVNLRKWSFELGDGGWGNHELQYYQPDNATVANGILTITGRREANGRLTSSRMRTLDMPDSGQWRYGRFEARMRVPSGYGSWPAFWMLPAHPGQPWPASGEIDIQETSGQRAMLQLGTIHYGLHGHKYNTSQLLIQPQTWADAFRVYAVDWQPGRISWYVDDQLMATQTPADMADPADWTFDQNKFYLLLNLALGGDFGGPLDAASLPQKLEVDYVRVYDRGGPALVGPRLAEAGSTRHYSISGAPAGAAVHWRGPGGEYRSGADFDMHWRGSGGMVSATISSACGSVTRSMEVQVALPMTLQSALRGVPETFTRNAHDMWNVLAMPTQAIADARLFLVGERAFFIDVQTDAPAGTPIDVQLEGRRTATGANYPTGRHSRYRGIVNGGPGWQHLKFVLVDRIDVTLPDSAVDQVVLMPDPGTLHGHHYQFRNFGIYALSARLESRTTN